MFQGLRAVEYINLIPKEVPTNFKKDKQYDNIWVRKDQWEYDEESHDKWSVIRDGLTYGNNHKPVSDHCPLWASIPYRNTTV